jgi:hypothetical protein
VALDGVHLEIVLGREGARRRPLSGAFPSAAGQPPRAAGQRKNCASGDIAAPSLPFKDDVKMRHRKLPAKLFQRNLADSTRLRRVSK